MSNIEKLIDLNKFGIKLGLENMEKLTASFNHPEQKVKIIHIAGTNGKGSTTMMSAQMLMLAGYKVATYTSPYTERINENFRINNQEISNKKLDELAKTVLDKITELAIEATHYEVCTMIMFLYAYQEQVDYLILEVGLGGRFDATNVVTPIVSIITNVSLDHTHLLGKTITEIAKEKTGIIKPGVPVLIGATTPEFTKVLANFPNQIIVTETLINWIKLDYENLITNVSINHQEYDLHLFGEHQAFNFAIVWQLAQLLKIEPEIIKQMAKVIKWDYRFQIYQQNPLIILDGAHNEASLLALKNALSGYEKEDIQIIFSALKDKDLTTMGKILPSISPNICLTSLNKIDKERGLKAEELQKKMRIKATIIENNNEAFSLIKSNNYPVNVICGSFTLLQSFEKNEKKL